VKKVITQAETLESQSPMRIIAYPQIFAWLAER
jgi:hypothetical protein